jgi:hypothetical protein
MLNYRTAANTEVDELGGEIRGLRQISASSYWKFRSSTHNNEPLSQEMHFEITAFEIPKLERSRV